MGCTSSSAVDPKPTNAQNSGAQAIHNGQPQATAGQAASSQNAAGNSAAAASASGSSANEPSESDVAKAKRRLSVAPGFTGETATEGKGDAEDESSYSRRHAAISNRGFMPYNRNKVNQDAYIVVESFGGNPDHALFGVLDGHGVVGHEVARFVKAHLPEYLLQEPYTTQPEQAITSAVEKMVNKLDTTHINCSFSGSTAVFGLFLDQTAYIANIGDSRCVMARQMENSLVAVPLTDDQKPDREDERKRIIKAGGRVEPLPGPPDEDMGPMRVWFADVDIPGLAMSRSIGDSESRKVGVTSIPEIKVHQISPQDQFMIFATDGVWEFMSNQEAVDIVAKNTQNLKQAVTLLASDATARWKQEEEVIDDITAVIISFGH